MDVNPTISSLTLGGTGGAQTLTNSGKTLTVNLASVVNTNGVLGMSAGTLTGLGSLNIYGQLYWNGSFSGNGFSLTVQSNAVLNILGGPSFSGIVTNLGTMNWLANNFVITTNGPTATGTIWNQPGALFDIQCDGVVVNGSSLATFHNAGLVRKRIATGLTTFNTALDNSGIVQAQTGTINFAGGSNLGGTFQANSGAAMNFTAGTFILSSPPDFQGPGPVQMIGGNLTLNAFTGTFSLSAVTLVGQNTVAATGTINLNATPLGSGATLTIASNAVLNIQGGPSFSGIVTNLGTVNWLANNFSITTNSPTVNGEFWNQPGALFDIQCDQVVVNGSSLATFHNAGLVRKHIATGLTTFNTFFDNSGVIQAQTGTINFGGGSNLGGTFQANSGAAMNFTAGTFTLSSPPDFQGPGPVQMIAGNLTLSAFTGTFSLNSITLVGQNTVAATGTINLNGTPLGSGATLTIASNAVLNIQGGLSFSGIVTNSGTVNWLANNFSITTNSPTVNGEFWNQAGALFDIQCDQVVVNGSSLATFHNAGLVRKHITAGLTTFNTAFDNSGIVQAQTGTINFAGGGNLGGTFQANSGAAMNFTGGTYALGSPPDFQGPGPVQITAGNLTLNAFTGTFTLSGTHLVGQNSIAATGTINLNGSPLDAGATLTIASNAVLNIQSGPSFSGIVTNLGTVNWLANNFSITTNGPTVNGTFWNQAGALFDIQCDQVVVNSSSLATFHNAGLVRKHITAGLTTFNTAFDNSGIVQAQTGTITFAGGGNPGGTFQASSGAAINFTGGTYALSSPPDFQGPGPIQISTATLNAFTGTFTLSGTTLVGDNTIAASGSINLISGSLGAGASLSVASNAVLSLQGANLSGQLINQGTVNWQAGNVTVTTNGSGATGAILNQTGALFDIQCDQILSFNALPASFHNAGLLRKSSAATTTAFTINLVNTGTIQAQNGLLSIQGSYTEKPHLNLGDFYFLRGSRLRVWQDPVHLCPCLCWKFHRQHPRRLPARSRHQFPRRRLSLRNRRFYQLHRVGSR